MYNKNGESGAFTVSSKETFDFEIVEVPDNPVIKQISVLVIGGNNFPLSQFHVADPDICEGIHYHAGIVYSIEGTAAEETQGECGFGLIGSLPVDVVDLTQDDIDSFKSLTGINL